MTKNINKKSNPLIALGIIVLLLIGAIFLTYSFKISSDSNDKSTSQTQVLPNENKVEIKDDESASINEPSANTEIEVSDNEIINSNNLNDIDIQVKDYILNGQNNKSDAEKLKWSNRFLEQVDFKSMYDSYLSTGGEANDVQAFSNYITLNSPIPTNWEDLFKQDIYDTYGQEVVRLEHLDGVSYEAYINVDGKEVPYVVVSSRTGYFHG